MPDGSDEVSLRHLAAPVLILPALARLSRRDTRPVLARWPGASIECRNGDVYADPNSHLALFCLRADWVTLSRLPAAQPAAAQGSALRHQGADVDAADWRDLVSYGQRSYVREGETSRLRGISSHMTDGD